MGEAVAWTDACLRRSSYQWPLDPSSRLATLDVGRKLGGYLPLGVELGPHQTQCCPGPRPTFVLTSRSIPFGHNKHGSKSAGLCPLWGEGRRIFTTSNNVAWAKAYQVASWSIHLGTMGRKLGACAPLGRGAGSHLTQCGAEAYVHAKFHFDPYNRLATLQTGQAEWQIWVWQTGQDTRTDNRRPTYGPTA